MFFSIVIPVYNRPQEIDELLESLTQQKYSPFEVIVVEDGSSKPAKHVVESYRNRLDIRYYEKKNEGQGFARNFGFTHAKGDYFIVFDSDIIVPEDYLQQVAAGIQRDGWDAFGGPDAAHRSFTDIQKAISYSMTSPFTTGGIRGNKQHVGKFHPRSFNMGISKKVYEQTRGFKLARRSEDIEFSIRMMQQGFRVGLIPEAFVYHKRRATFKQFFKQNYGFAKGGIDIYKLFPYELMLLHALLAVFLLGLAGLIVLNLIRILPLLCGIGNIVLLIYTFLLFLHAWFSTKNIRVAGLGIVAAYIQLIAYGLGFINNYVKQVMWKK